MEINLVEVDKIIPYARNPRKNISAIAKVSASLQEFGWQQPIVVDSEMVVIAGHTRLLAAQQLNMQKAPVFVARNLTDEQVKAYRLADNRVGQEAEWDDELLSLELSDLDNANYDLGLTGFTDKELQLHLAEELVEGLTDEDEVPDLPNQPVTKLGDIWQLGNHRVMCGDSTKINLIKNFMSGKKANICFTSPPYNVGFLNIKKNKGTNKKYNSFNDNLSEQDYFKFLSLNLECMLSVSNEVFYNIGLVQDNKKTIFKIINKFNDTFKDIIYWKKNNVAPHIQKGIINNLVEFIICFGNGKRKFLNAQFNQGSYFNVIEGNNASQNKYSNIHKATFPVYLPENIIKNFTAQNDIVIDCFGGSGTTLIACEKNKRICYMIELDPKYCDVIIKRWQDFTGKKAILEGSNKEFTEAA